MVPAVAGTWGWDCNTLGGVAVEARACCRNAPSWACDFERTLPPQRSVLALQCCQHHYFPFCLVCC